MVCVVGDSSLRCRHCAITPQDQHPISLPFSFHIQVDDFLYALSARMPTLPTNQPPLSLTLRGRSLRPVCHFALQESPDYLQRRQSHLLANDLGQQVSGITFGAWGPRGGEQTGAGMRVRSDNSIRMWPYDTPHFDWLAVAPGRVSCGKLCHHGDSSRQFPRVRLSLCSPFMGSPTRTD